MRMTICIYTLGDCGKIFSQARNSFRLAAKSVPLECVKSHWSAKRVLMKCERDPGECERSPGKV